MSQEDRSTDRSAQYEYEWYPTPRPFIRWLGEHLPSDRNGEAIYAEPCVGDSVIPTVLGSAQWITNDLDPRWVADTHLDATWQAYWNQLPETVEGIITNPPYSCALPILQWALSLPQTPFIALHVRLSFLEPLKKNATQRRLLQDYPPSKILVLPRFPYQTNAKGVWSQDTVTSAWMIWNSASAEHHHGVTRMVWPSERLMRDTAKAATARRRGLPEMHT